ncbi:hypothetical protein F2P81_021467 [Scophthalmus maximus]|uniref:Uncharacterized protein n=1 Tax=Scophthalmus maximus TaxID=52904 RepID=A0A6A4S5C2_SCOMX|nr:hypothetical protein F2P81_021467 [Scophthalmus maximus]
MNRVSCSVLITKASNLRFLHTSVALNVHPSATTDVAVDNFCVTSARGPSVHDRYKRNRLLSPANSVTRHRPNKRSLLLLKAATSQVNGPVKDVRCNF